MNNDFITILECHSQNNVAAKKFSCSNNGEINCQGYNAGVLFNYKECLISSLDDIEKVLLKTQANSQKFFIRGKVREGLESPIYRRSMSEPCHIEPAKHKWIMIDIDDLTYPSNMNLQDKPEEIITWAKSKLPRPFQEAECVYQFSSSQSMTDKLQDDAGNTLKVHLFYWCDDFVADNDWKSFFKTENAPVDLSLYNPVQPHYVANPIFSGMSDPIAERVGRC